MKTINETISSRFDDWHAFQDSLNWSSYQIQNENIHDSFLEAMRCGVNRHAAFNEVENRINKAGKTIGAAVMYKIWHSARCLWRSRQHAQRSSQPMRIRPAINGQEPCKSVNKQGNVKVSRNEGDANILVIDGLNVIYGTPSRQNPSLMNLLSLLLALQKRNFTFKCFFDATTPFKLIEAGGTDEANAYRRLCYDFPDTFIEVPSRNQADGFLLQYAHHTGSQLISNDCFRDYYQKYPWLQTDYKRRVSFIVHSHEMQIPALDLMASVPTDLPSAVLSFRAGFENLVPDSAPLESSHTNNHAHTKENIALAA